MFKILMVFRKKFTLYLIGCVLLSGMISAALGLLIANLGISYIETRYDDDEQNRYIQIKYVDDLQRFVKEQEITSSNISKVKEWTDDNTYVYIAIYQSNKMIFNSDYAAFGVTQGDEEDYSMDEESLLDETYLYRLKLADGSLASVDMFCYDYWQYYSYAWAFAISFGIFVFVAMLTKLLHIKMKYIKQIETELHILEGGNLENPITIRGEDEIASLARGIEQMRISIVGNIEKEQKMLQANKDLVTSMSHDLRTPLTTLTGYLEILNMDKVKDEEQRKHYLALSLAKSQEIKRLSDELFEYFLIYGEDHKEIELEEVSVVELVMDLSENQFLTLEEEGFTLQCQNEVEETDRTCLINPQYMQRVLNNILSNLLKYAEKSIPINMKLQCTQKELRIEIENAISADRDLHESTKIGLITCKRIMKLHHGTFESLEKDEVYTVRIRIPVTR